MDDRTFGWIEQLLNYDCALLIEEFLIDAYKKDARKILSPICKEIPTDTNGAGLNLDNLTKVVLQSAI